MAEVAKILGQALLTATAAAVYTVATSTTVRVSSILIHNNDSAERIATIHYVQSGASATNTNKVYTIALKAGETAKLVDEGFFGAGDSIRALADAASQVNITISGIEIK